MQYRIIDNLGSVIELNSHYQTIITGNYPIELRPIFLFYLV